MDSSNRSRSKRDLEERTDAKDSSRNNNDDDREHSDKRKHRSSKSGKHSDEQIPEDQDNGRRKSSGDRSDGRRKSGSSSSRAGSGDEDEYRESHSKIPRRNPEERGEPRSNDGYRDRDSSSSQKSRGDDHERKMSARPSSHESSQGKSRSRAESSHEGELEKVQVKDSRHSDKEGSREKVREQREQERDPPHRRLDDMDTGRKGGDCYVDRSDSRNSKSSDHSKHATSRDRTTDSRNESGETRSWGLESSGEKDGRSSYREERRDVDSKVEKDGRSSYREEKAADEDRSRNWVRSEAQDEHNTGACQTHESRPDTGRDDRQRKGRERSVGLAEDAEPHANRNSVKSPGEKGEKYRQERVSSYGSRDELESRERSDNMDEDGHTLMKDKDGREVKHNRRSRTPERSGRHHRDDGHDPGLLEHESERNSGIKRKEREESCREERASKGMDNSPNGKNRDREGFKDHWKAAQSRQDNTDVDKEFDHVKEWDSQRHDQERVDNSRPGYRKDTRIRPEGVKSNSIEVRPNRNFDFGSKHESSDSIEIKLNKNFDFGREEPVSSFRGRRAEMGSQQDFASGASDEEGGYLAEDRGKMSYGYGDGLQEKFQDDGSPMAQNSGRNSLDSQSGKGRGQKGAMNSNRTVSGQSSSSGSQPPFGNNQGPGSFNRALQQGPKGGRPARGGRRMTGRDSPRGGMQIPLMGPPFGHLGLPPGPMQPIGPNMSHSPSPMGPSVFIPSFPLVWPGARGVDMNILAIPPNLPPIPPPGPAGPKFVPSMGNSPNHSMYFNQPGHGRGTPPNISSSGFNETGPIGREIPHDKAITSWVPSRNIVPPGKAPSRGEQNDYSQNFVDTGMRPQNFIRELELTSVVEDYPKLRELIQRKDEIVAKASSPPMYYKCDLREFELSPEFFGTKFDVILVDPPWEEYVHRAPGASEHLENWTFEEIQNLKIEAIADTPSFIFLWVGDGVGLEQGRQCLKKWGFRRCEDICWVKTNKRNAMPGLRHDSRTLFQHSKEHCLMGIKGTVRRSTDGHIIHANIDTDIVIAEEPDDGSTKKPEDMYKIIEHFALGRRRLELFGEDHNIRSGWVTVGKGLSSSNYNAEAYIRNFSDKDGKVWHGGSGRNPPPESPHLVLTTPEIESLRPKSPPPKNQQQQQQQSMSIITVSSNNRRPSGSSPQTSTPIHHSGSNQDGLISELDDKSYDGYGVNGPSLPAIEVGDCFEIDPRGRTT